MFLFTSFIISTISRASLCSLAYDCRWIETINICKNEAAKELTNLMEDSEATDTSKWWADATEGLNPYTLCFHKAFFPAKSRITFIHWLDATNYISPKKNISFKEFGHVKFQRSNVKKQQLYQVYQSFNETSNRKKNSIPKSRAPTRTQALVTSRQRLQLKFSWMRRFDSLCDRNESLKK